uniref:Methyltransferase n=1 Tax=Rheinheimera sp. BAL341 TaxID=1708203 RepID=A0A486XVI7_9GAMM
MTDNVNTAIWDDLYKKRQSLLKYPDSTFVTLLHRHLSIAQHCTVLDYGFGGGANMRVMLRRGHRVTGVEISDAVIQINQQILVEEGLNATLVKTEDNALPFADNSFDAIVPWHVLGYNSVASISSVLQEFKRVLKPDGVVLATLPAFGDVSHQGAKKISDWEYVSNVVGQEGAHVLCLPDEQSVCALLSQPDARVGLMQSPLLDGQYSRHWVFSYANRK